MNERIKAVAQQAEIKFEATLEHSGIDTAVIIPADLEKFAELIIKECLGDLKERIALRYQGSEKDRDIAYGMEIVYMDIVDKFGVEE
jgi:hypothetical protein